MKRREFLRFGLGAIGYSFVPFKPKGPPDLSILLDEVWKLPEYKFMDTGVFSNSQPGVLCSFTCFDPINLRDREEIQFTYTVEIK